MASEKKELFNIAKIPWVYDLIQYMVGSRIVYRHLAAQTAGYTGGSVLDLGGGTGLYRKIWDPSCDYICLDIDQEKIDRFTKKHPDCKALVADATDIPLEDNSIDVILCIAVSHHLTETSFAKLISESHRVLKRNGSFLFLDAVEDSRRLLSRLMWKYDQGSYPHTREQLLAQFSRKFDVVYQENFKIFHKYLLCKGKK